MIEMRIALVFGGSRSEILPLGAVFDASGIDAELDRLTSGGPGLQGGCRTLPTDTRPRRRSSS
jgi:hypothetical protein